MRKKKLKSPTRLVALLSLLILVVGIFTGCGFAGPAHVEEKYRPANPSSGNILCVNWENALSSANADGQHRGKEKGLFWHIILKPDVNYGIDSKNSITLVREAAAMMFNSLFNQRFEPDQFMGDQPLVGFTLNPSTLIKEVNTVTMSAMGSQNSLGGILRAIQGMAAGILITVWAMGFISQIVNEKFTMETLLKTFMQLLCGILLITNAGTIVSAFSDAGNSLVDQISGGNPGSSFTQFASDMRKDMNTGIHSFSMGFSMGSFINAGFGTMWFDVGSLKAIVFMVVPFICQIICAFKIVSMMVMRMLELTIRITFAPIPIAFSAQSGFSQEAIRYFRSILACATQPVLMLVGAACSDTIADCVLKIFASASVGSASYVTGAIAMSISYLILSAYLGETKHLAQEVIAR